MSFKNVAIEFGLSIACILVIALLYYLVPDKDFGISVFFFVLVCFSLCISDFKLFFGSQVMVSANLIPLYIWMLWFLFIHDRYGNSEEGSMVLWVKSLLMILLLPVSHAKSVRNNFILNSIIFTTTALLFVVPIYTPKITMELSIREIFLAAGVLLLKTVVYLAVFITANIRNEKQAIVTMNNSLWVLGSSAWFMPVAFLQIGIYLFQHSNSSSPTLPVTKPNRKKKPRDPNASAVVRPASQSSDTDVQSHIERFRQSLRQSGNP